MCVVKCGVKEELPALCSVKEVLHVFEEVVGVVSSKYGNSYTGMPQVHSRFWTSKYENTTVI